VSVKTRTVTIGDGETESTVLTVADNLPAGIKTPSGWTTADITFTASESEGGTYVPVYDTSGSALTISSVVASRWYAITPQDFAGTPYLKLVASVAQAGGDALIVAMRRND
jgi:hypothetical protein